MDPLEILAHLAGVGTPPDGPTALAISVGLDATIERLKSETLPFLAGGGSELQFVYGQYGRGKSHFLQTVREVASRKGFVTAYVDCRAGRSPFKSVRDTYVMLAENMAAPPTHDSTLPAKGVAGLIKQQVQGGDRHEVLQLLTNIRGNPHLAPDFRNLVYAYALRCVANDSRHALREALEALLNADASYRVTLGALHQANPDLPRPIGKLGSRNAGLWIRSLLSLPRALGYPGLVVLFDETERGHSFGTRFSRGQQEHLANLRNFVDYMALGTFRGVAIFYAVVEDFIEVARERLEALSQRIERVRISLDNDSRVDDRNPRAVWVSLDELTFPTPLEPSFFGELGKKIIGVGLDAGLTQGRARSLAPLFEAKAEEAAGSFYEGAVREFVKFAAAQVAQGVTSDA